VLLCYSVTRHLHHVLQAAFGQPESEQGGPHAISPGVARVTDTGPVPLVAHCGGLARIVDRGVVPRRRAEQPQFAATDAVATSAIVTSLDQRRTTDPPDDRLTGRR
jgi:hypothetical protein